MPAIAWIMREGSQIWRRAITEKRRPRLPADFCLHVTELALAIQNANRAPYKVTTTFEPLQPLDDAGLKELIPAGW